MNIRRALSRLKRRFLKKPPLRNKNFPTYWFHRLLKDRAAQIVQIGSNDGKTGDPIYMLLQKNKSWKGLFVEPVPYLFERLKKNYSDSARFRFEQAAINDGKAMDFYWVDPKIKESETDLPFWFDQLGSFDRSHIAEALDGKLEPFIVSEKLEGIQLFELFERHDLSQFDLLHIDAEGHDWKILSQLDLNKFQPTFILFEHSHLSKSELRAAYDFLNSMYRLFEPGIDVFAVHMSVGEKHLLEIQREMKIFEPTQIENFSSKNH